MNQSLTMICPWQSLAQPFFLGQMQGQMGFWCMCCLASACVPAGCQGCWTTITTGAVPHLSLMQNDVQVKRMHISMCIKEAMRDRAAAQDCCLVLLDKIMFIRTSASVSPQALNAITQALPGRSSCLTLPHHAGHACVPQ